MAKRSTSLAAQVANLRLMVEAHIARTRPRASARVIYQAGASDDEIPARKLAAAAEKGVAPEQVTQWIERIMVTPPPCVEAPSPLRGGPHAELPDKRPDNALAEPRQRFERKPDVSWSSPSRASGRSWSRGRPN